MIISDFENGFTIDVMASTMLEGKAPKDWNWTAFYKTFQRVSITPRQLAVHIWRGHSFTPVWAGSRKEESYVTAYHLAYDFDGGDEQSSLPFLLGVGKFAWMFASFGYTTPSHTPEAPRSRLVFVMEYPIDSPTEYREVYQAVAWMIAGDGSYTDPACKDPLRLYYGSKGCEVATNWSVLGKATIDQVLSDYRAAHPVHDVKPVAFTAPIVPDDKMQNGKLAQLGEKVRNAPINEGHNALLKMARLAGGYVATGSLNEGDAIAELTAAALTRPNQDEKEIERVIRDGIANGKAAPVSFEQARPLMEMFR